MFNATEEDNSALHFVRGEAAMIPEIKLSFYFSISFSLFPLPLTRQSSSNYINLHLIQSKFFGDDNLKISHFFLVNASFLLLITSKF